MGTSSLSDLLGKVEVELREIKAWAADALEYIETIIDLHPTEAAVHEKLAKQLHAIRQEIGLPSSGGDVVEALRQTLVLWREAEAIVGSLALLTQTGRCKVCHRSIRRDGECDPAFGCLGAVARYYVKTRGSKTYSVAPASKPFAGA